MSQILSQVDGSVALVTLNRPEKLNAFTGTMREDLLQALTKLEHDPVVRVVVIRGAGRGFCGGGDVRYMQELRDTNNVSDFSRILDAANAVARCIHQFSKVTIASVHGPAAGGGANLALACDFRLGATDCSFTQSFVKIGLGPDWGGSFLLPQIVGPDRARELLLTGRSVRAEEAVSLGLVHQLCETSELPDTTRAVAEKMSENSPHAVATIKGAIRAAASFDAALEYERSAQIRCFLTEEAYSAFANFSQRIKQPRQES